MISVVIPLYNKEKSILNTILSVLNQTYKNFEVIIVNDGSTDKSLELIQSIKDDRIKIITQKNGGVSRARNTGIKTSKYQYIAFIDGDDIWLPWHLETIIQMIKDYPQNNIGGYCTRIIKSKNINQPSLKNKLIKPGVLVDNYVKEVSGTDSILSSSSFASKKLCLYDVGLYDESLSYGEDVELWYRLFNKYKLVASNSVSVLYLLYSENRSDKKITPLIKRFHDFDFDDKPEYEKKYLGKLVCLIILDYLMQGAYKICFKVFWKYKSQTHYILAYFLGLTKKRIVNTFKFSHG